MDTTTSFQNQKKVSHDEWIAARKEFLKKEKEFTRQRDELSRLRRALPWEKVEKNYEFEGPAGKVSLSDLFGGRSQLVVYHFMLGPGWKEGCPSCSYISDHFDGMTIHLANRDVTLAVVSRAPIAEIESFKRRMGWKFRWLSSNASDFNFDYQVSQTPEEARQKAGLLQLRDDGVSRRGATRTERLRERCERSDLPHLLHLCSRSRGRRRHGADS